MTAPTRTIAPRSKRPVVTKRGRPAWQYPLVRHKPPMTNREWQEHRRRAREADIFEGLFARLLTKGRGK